MSGFSVGLLLDLTGSYRAIIPTSIFFLFISFISFGATILSMKKKKIADLEENAAPIRSEINADYGSAH